MAIFAAFGILKDKFTTWFNNAKDAAIDKFWDLVDWVKGLPDRILDALGDMGNFLKETGGDMIDGLISGLKNSVGAVTDWISGMLGDVKDQVLDFFGIASPSKLMKYYGKMVGKGFEVGLEFSTSGIQDAAELMSQAANPMSADITSRNTANVSAAVAAPAAQQTVNVYPQAADNRFSLDEITTQVKMAV
jgi:hypothetical protein